MTSFVAMKALAGYDGARPARVAAVAASDPAKRRINMIGGATIPSSEPSKDVMVKLATATGDRTSEPTDEAKSSWPCPSPKLSA
jgi:hypothetical protein